MGCRKCSPDRWSGHRVTRTHRVGSHNWQKQAHDGIHPVQNGSNRLSCDYLCVFIHLRCPLITWGAWGAQEHCHNILRIIRTWRPQIRCLIGSNFLWTKFGTLDASIALRVFQISLRVFPTSREVFYSILGPKNILWSCPGISIWKNLWWGWVPHILKI